MLKVRENNIKLQIWDTVQAYLDRQDKKALKPSPEVTIAMLLEQLSYMISLTDKALTMWPSGSNRQRLMAHPP